MSIKDMPHTTVEQVLELRQAAIKLEDECKRLWIALDDISTAGDAFKPEHTGYFKYVNQLCSQGLTSKIISSDGYSLTINFGGSNDS